MFGDLLVLEFDATVRLIRVKLKPSLLFWNCDPKSYVPGSIKGSIRETSSSIMRLFQGVFSLAPWWRLRSQLCELSPHMPREINYSLSKGLCISHWFFMWWEIYFENAKFFPRVIFLCFYRERPNPKKPWMPHTTGPKPHQLRTPTPKPNIRPQPQNPNPPNPQTRAKMTKKYK